MASVDLFQTLSNGLPDRYRLEREIASGGMAHVFLAQDLRHGHLVAIKVLKPELAALLGSRRFLNEIQVTRNLVHPYILPIYDSGSAGGLLYYVMPYLNEDSLRVKLASGPLPVEHAVKTAREVADALDFAHRHNVIHRDLKPENILMRAGHAVVADFGIARAIHRAGGEKLTETGVFLGTATYASPEQAAGGTDLDGRSDLYSLGCILHEMLTGSPPYVSDRMEAVFGMHALAPIPDAGQARANVPPGVRRALRRVLAKNRDERFSTGAEFSTWLAGGDAQKSRSWLAWTAAAAVTIGILVITPRPPPDETGMKARDVIQTGAPSLAVLPFRNLSGGENGNQFAAGLCEELRDRMAKVPGLRVAAGSASNRWGGSDRDLQTVGQALRVSMILEGSVRVSGNRCRTSAQLINIADGYMLWADTYDRTLDDSLGAQEEVADAVVAFLTATVLSADVIGTSRQPSLER